MAEWPQPGRSWRGARSSRPCRWSALSVRHHAESAHSVEGFRRGLRDAGYVEGENVHVEYRWADGHYDRLPALAADLVAKHPAVIVAIAAMSILAVKAATSDTPIVFFGGNDPIADGLIASFNRPGGLMTGLYLLVNELVAKQLEILHEVMPTASTLGLLDNPASPSAEVRLRVARNAARKLGIDIQVVHASADRDFATGPSRSSLSKKRPHS